MHEVVNRLEILRQWRGAEARHRRCDHLAVFGEQFAGDDRDRLGRLVPGVQIEEWPGRGHFVHLAEADRFAVVYARSSTSARPAAAFRRPSLAM